MLSSSSASAYSVHKRSQVSHLVVVDSVGRVAELVFHQRARPPHSLSEVLRNRHTREIEKADFTCGVVQDPNEEGLAHLEQAQNIWDQDKYSRDHLRNHDGAKKSWRPRDRVNPVLTAQIHYAVTCFGQNLVRQAFTLAQC